MKHAKVGKKLVMITATFIFIALAGHVLSNSTFSRGKQAPASLEWQSPVAFTSSPHGPIIINGNDALDAFCDGNFTDGLTSTTAHVICDYSINASGSGSCIVIQNTNRYLVIRNCTTIESGTTSNDAGIMLSNCTNVNVTGCVTSNNGYAGITLYLSDNNAISDNIANNNSVYGIYLNIGCEGNVIDNNTACDVGTMNQDQGIYLYSNCHNNTISGNIANNNMIHGIHLYHNCDGNVIANNTACNVGTTSQDDGICLDMYCDANTISGNTANNNMEFGIFLIGICNSNMIHNNTACNVGTTNQNDGIYLYSNCDNNTISGNIANNHFYNGICIEKYCDGNEIANNTACNVEATIQEVGIYVRTNCDANTVSGNTVNNNDVRGIYLNEDCHKNVIANNTACNVGTTNQDDGIFVYDDCDNNTISGNIANDNTIHGIYLNAICDGNVIANNTAGNAGTTNQDDGIFLDSHCDANTISGNIANNNMDYGIYLYGICSSNMIHNNTACNVGTTNQDNGIFVYSDCDNNTISGNIANDNTIHGIYLNFLCSGNVIANNTAGNAGTSNQDDGIYLYSNCDNNTISGNIANDNTAQGIYLNFLCDGNVIANNTACNVGTTNQDDGIYLYSNCDNNTISGNIVIENRYHGIRLNDGCDWNIISRNNIYQNGIGISLVTSIRNLVYFNWMMFNIAGNAFDNGTAIEDDLNKWDNGTTGNHWSDYTGVDMDGDGIGESWHAIPGPANTFDHKPLAQTRPQFMLPANDMSYEAGTTGHALSWIVIDNTPWLLSYSISIDGNVVLNGDLHGTSEMITIMVNGLSVGMHLIVCEVMDGYGSTNIDTAQVGVTNTAPAFTTTPPGQTLEGGSTGNVVAWTFADPSVASPVYSVSRDGIPAITGIACVPGVPINMSIDGLNVGTHVFHILVEDGLGGSCSDIVEVVVTNTAPAFTTTPPGQSLEGGSTGNVVAWTFADPSVASPVYSVSRDGIPAIAGIACVPGVPINMSIDGLNVGTHVFHILVEDGLGGSCSDIVEVVVTNTAPAFTTTPPDLSFEAGSTGNVVAWTFADPSVASPVYSVSRDGIPIIAGIACVPGVSITVPVDGLETGLHVICITIDDGFGGTISDFVQVTVTGNTGLAPDQANAIITGIVVGATIVAVAILVNGFLSRKRNVPAGLRASRGRRDNGLQNIDQEPAPVPERD